MAAALEVLIEHGYANFSASRVATRAGVSRGALERYFPTRNDLLVAATQHAMDAAVVHARGLADRNGRPTVERFLADSEHFFFRPLFRAMLELAIAAASDPALAKVHHPIVARARKTLNRIWLETLMAAGFPRQRAERFILLTHYLLRGLFVVQTWLPYQTNRRAVIKEWEALVPAVLGPEHAAPKSARPGGRKLRQAKTGTGPKRGRAGRKPPRK